MRISITTIWLTLTACLCLFFQLGSAQADGSLTFEPGPFSELAGGLSDDAEAYVLLQQSRRALLTTDILMQTVCVSDLKPPWLVHVYHPKTVTRDSTSGAWDFGQDTLQYMVCVTQVKGPLQRDSCGQTISKTQNYMEARFLPDSCAWLVTAAFSKALSNARWPQEDDLELRLECTKYHFCAYEESTKTFRSAFAISPKVGTRAEQLIDISSALIKFVAATDVSIKGAILSEIPAMCRRILE